LQTSGTILAQSERVWQASPFPNQTKDRCAGAAAGKGNAMPVLQQTSDSRRHPQPALLRAAEDVVLDYIRTRPVKRTALSTLRRMLLPTNSGLLLSAVDRLVARGILVAKVGGLDIIIELADSPAQEVGR